MYPRTRGRRLRESDAIRSLVRETRLSPSELVYPIFVIEGEGEKREISSMPGNYHFSADMLADEISELRDLGINAVLIFGVPGIKDSIGSEAYRDAGVVQRAVRNIKAQHPDMLVITDVCMCQYTDHGHCGLLSENGRVDNDRTLEYLSRIALSHARAGADMVAPSDMMDGRVGHIRDQLDDNEYKHVGIMSYAVKYASAFYGPFRDAAGSAPSFGDRKTYQMDPANTDEALREARADIDEGADIIIVKPALAYLDVVRRVKDSTGAVVAAYNVSGEYAMLKGAVESGILGEDAIMESLISIKRAGADIIITYFAKEIARKLRGK
ncbi:delta-aminolevulinic acid dehydratase HemB (plasmid) [Peptoclostridium acidaminophilum DSM 3953]|uniref:Delta-aminolevulinic acid dehydratase n=1 Tax=Peptoclostridium acidaminophilum DSM 3953 TaxID=1286171 RepID=W8TIG8_PEPAC|nr:porphobilinogen synthase [Peptoclostridium acidaminophilum]AHM57618.1 delta-aminolevulinic acid dehydratase HemB [Peptoclostridium acidaminophilum DSM 3953]